MTEPPRCPGLFGIHRFEARYDRRDTETGLTGSGQSKTEWSETRTYVHDICIRCGHVVKRQ
jgi:hypothetical protein